jgi:hypothetical protein
VVEAIAGLSFEPNRVLRSMLLDEAPTASQLDDQDDRRLLTIRAADTEGHRSSAHILVKRMYAWRGYSSPPAVAAGVSNRITLLASDHEVTIGTITVGFDVGEGLLVDELFHDHVQRLRDDGLVLCEFTKLAMDGVARSKPVLASLFHTAFIYAHEIKGCDKLLIEVNPRHVRFYESMLGFNVLAPERMNGRVNAPAVLMMLDLAYAGEQIGRVHRDPAATSILDRSLYRHSFSRDEATGIVNRLRRRGDA